MDDHDAQRTDAQRPGPQDKLALFDREHLCPDHAGHVGPRQQADDENDEAQAPAGNGNDHQHQRQGRDDEDGIGEAHEQEIDPAAGITRGDADHTAEKYDDDRGGKANQQGDARAIDHQAEHVPAALVGPQGMLAAGRSHHVFCRRLDRLVRIVGGDPGRKDGEQDHRQEHDRTQNARLLAQKRAPKGPRRRLGFGGFLERCFLFSHTLRRSSLWARP